VHITWETLNTLHTFDADDDALPRKQKENASRRNVVLKIETYTRLEKYLVELVKKKGVPRVSFDEAINELLDRVG